MLEFTKVKGDYHGDIKLFALSTCGWCKKTKKFLEDNNVAFSYVYVDKLEEEDLKSCLEIQRSYTKEEAYPLVAIGQSECIVGFDKEKLEKLLER